MVYQTLQLLQPNSVDTGLLGFVFFATLCSYNLHWYLTPNIPTEKIRSQWTRQHRKLQLLLAGLGALGAFICFTQLHGQRIWILPAMLLTFLYSAPKFPLKPFSWLKKIAIGKTLFLSLVWLYVTTALPLLLAGVSWTTQAILFTASRFFLLYPICILFDYRDRESDKTDGIRSLVTYLSDRNIDRLFVGCFFLFIAVTCALAAYGFSIPLLIMLLLPGTLTAALYRYAQRNHSDYLYYFVLDGLMMFSSLLTLFLPF